MISQRILTHPLVLRFKKAPHIRIMDWYLMKEISVPLVYSLFAFVMLFVIYDLSIHFSDFFEHGIKFSVLLVYYISSIPFIFVNAAPIAVLMASLYCLGQLGKNNEITAFQASGIGLLRLSYPFLLIGILMSFLVFFINENIVPKATQESELLEKREIKKETKEAEKWTEFVYKSPHTGRHWVGSYNPEKLSIKKAVIREFRPDGSLKFKYMANELRWIEDSWWLFNGTLVLFDLDSKQIGSEEIIKKELRASGKKYETPQDFENSRKPTYLMNLQELMTHMSIHEPTEKVYQSELVDFHYKIAFPFISLVVIFLGVPLGLLQSGKRGGSALAGFGISLALCLCFYAFTLTTLALGKQGWISAWLGAWLPNLVFSLIGIGLGFLILRR